MQTGNKVKHVNTGDIIYTVKSLHNKTAVITKPKELHRPLYPKIKTSIIVDTCICRIENLIPCNEKTS
jgi:hypothetical protein